MEIKTPQTYTDQPLIIAPAEAKPRQESAQLAFF